MSNEIQRHERYKQYAKNAYELEKSKFPEGVFVYGFQQNPETGFFGYALIEKDNVVVVFRGTDKKSCDTVKTDYKNDINMAIFNKIPEQVTDALKFYDEIKSRFPNKKIDVTGHSLGGSLAQYVAIMRNVNEAVCFCPVGIISSMKDYLSKYGSKTEKNKIINYNNPNDILTKHFRDKLFGVNYSIDSVKSDGDMHSLEEMRPLSTRKKINQGDKQKDKVPTLQTGCVGSYPVSGYTRSDGTKVEGYIRTCGAKHKGMSSEERRAGQAKYKNKRFQDIPLDELETAIGYFI